MQDIPLITNSNGKLGQFIYHFSISTKSCKHRTKHCKKYCYAKRGHMGIHQGDSERYGINYKWTKHDDFIGLIVSQINLIRRDLEFFRIHTSGDFYNQEYFDKWCTICRYFPEIQFLVYTRNYNVDCSKAPRNMSIKFSMDNTTKRTNPTIDSFTRVDYLLDSYEDIETHLESKGKYLICRSKCTDCRECWTSDTNILFPLKHISLTVLELSS